jgi:hypothetical protein
MDIGKEIKRHTITPVKTPVEEPKPQRIRRKERETTPAPAKRPVKTPAKQGL